MFNIVIVGVGGQGTLLASKILGQLAMNNGYEVRVSEVHGMSQRGGSVVTYVRISNDQPLYSSIVEQGQADIVLAFGRHDGCQHAEDTAHARYYRCCKVSRRLP